jgi:hypothetical protein
VTVALADAVTGTLLAVEVTEGVELGSVVSSISLQDASNQARMKMMTKAFRFIMFSSGMYNPP